MTARPVECPQERLRDDVAAMRADIGARLDRIETRLHVLDRRQRQSVLGWALGASILLAPSLAAIVGALL